MRLVRRDLCYLRGKVDLWLVYDFRSLQCELMASSMPRGYLHLLLRL